MGRQVIMAIIVCVKCYVKFLCFFMKFMYMNYVLDFSLLGIRLIPFCLYVQENSYSGGKGSWMLGEWIQGVESFDFRG